MKPPQPLFPELQAQAGCMRAAHCPAGKSWASLAATVSVNLLAAAAHEHLGAACRFLELSHSIL